LEVITSGYTRKCKDSLGGLDKIYLFSFAKYPRSQIVTNENVLTSFPNTTIYAFEYVGNPVFDNKGNEDAGGKYYDEDISFQLAKISDNFSISKLLKKDLRAIIKDKNGYYRILGLYNGLECESIKASVGTSKNSLNGYTIALKGQEEQEALYINNLEDAGFTEDGFYLLQEDGFYLLQENDFKILL